MELRTGDKVKYTFPAPVNEERRSITGYVDHIGESFIYIKCMDNSLMRISFKNFDFLELMTANKSQNN
jgi:hypothetical protein